MYDPCELCAREERDGTTNQRLFCLGVPRNFLGKSFDTYVPRTDRNRANLGKLITWAKDPRGTVCLSGPGGSGKTHLAVGALRGQKAAQFVEASGVIERMQRGEAFEFKDRLSVVPFLVVDNLDDVPDLEARDELKELLVKRTLPVILTGRLAQDLVAIIGQKAIELNLSFDGPGPRSRPGELPL